ncbi:chemotaxis protein CheA [Grimontia hollisae]|uniref:Chemotaxis protein CheA n=1 Tax=Grimontia hollisae CIP 101886 TaxID=675812 RepID=D0I4S2_GRIHO|nr:chemotaxis protein CheA [Grimontia hollisae]AUW37804.1 chemotaxis protein CheA [Grimontia hollisae]EEY73489.1 chemotaxis protein CheA [Grimontia hollisae CIP 101886]STO42521.1 Chemotaxis protein CheA [Grimontia hollisae]
MALDMDQLRRIFYEECRENLEILERELLALDPDADVDLDIINTIFRAAHSIKGGGATFNLNEISQFTHVMETLLDEAREGKRRLDASTIDLLLKGGDCINSMLVAYETESDFDHALRDALTEQLNILLNDGLPASSGVASPPAGEDTPAETAHTHAGGWVVQFVPHKDMFFSGNDPVRILREMFDLGADCVIECVQDTLPAFHEIEPEMCYLSWKIMVDGIVGREQIEEIFEWVEDECELDISQQMSTGLSDTESLETESQPTQDTSPSKDVPVNTPAVSAPPSATKAKAPTAKVDAVSSIRVEIDKVDNLINLVGELVITQSMLTELSQNFSENKLERLQAGLDQLLQNTKELQESVLNIRMLPISFAFNRFPRLIRDLSSQLGKSVELVIEGEQTELDKTVLERITDPLVHLVRNAVDHGLELPQVRRDKGKSETGRVDLFAYHQGGSIVIEVRDDGAGLNKERVWKKALEKGLIHADIALDDLSDHQVYNLIFAPGFSTAEVVSDVSGRGVGMDVVKRNIEDLGGHIEVNSKPDKGSVFRISLPLTLAILDGQLVKLADQVFVVPLISIIESIQIESERVKVATGGVELYRLRDENIPILRLKEEFGLGGSGALDKQLLCLVEAGGNRIGLLLDELLGQQQVVIKSLESNYTRVNGISGATILGDGSVSLILDVQGLMAGFLSRVGDGNTHIAA